MSDTAPPDPSSNRSPAGDLRSPEPAPPLPPHADPARWDALVESAGPDGILVAIEHMMGPGVRALCDPEDIWQETLVAAWRDAAGHTWTGVRAWRAWVLTIAAHRIADQARAAGAEKRGSGERPLSLDAAPPGSGDASSAPGGLAGLLPAGSVTPSRIASHRERATILREALASLPAEQADVLRLHLFLELPVAEVARRLAIGEKAARYRLRTGMESYVRRLEALRSRLDSRTRG